MTFDEKKNRRLSIALVLILIIYYCLNGVFCIFSHPETPTRFDWQLIYLERLVSDFFCPNAGGVETHVYFLAQCLLQQGHKAVVITHSYGARKGIRLLSNGLKVYYLPFIVAYNGCTLPTVLGGMPWYRKIFLRERIDIVHGHSTFSSMAHEAMFHAWQLGLHTVFTDHSLFGFADASAILTNSLVLKYSLAPVDRIICVSYTSKENTVLRGHLDPSRVCTIPNAIETSLFTPDRLQFYRNPTTVVFIGRLAYRKGADLLCEIIPRVCARYQHVRFLVGGDGPKRVELEEMLERNDLQIRVKMLGMVPHDRVRDVLVQGQIFINTSLTEAFCMAIVEAASCGLHVVTTRVGGVPEVLPDDFVTLQEPVPHLLLESLCSAIDSRDRGELMDPVEKHNAVTKMYFWPDVAERTNTVYQEVIENNTLSWKEGFRRYAEAGLWFGILYIMAASINIFFLVLLRYFDPVEKIPEANDRIRFLREAPESSHSLRCQEESIPKDPAGVSANRLRSRGLKGQLSGRR